MRWLRLWRSEGRDAPYVTDRAVFEKGRCRARSDSSRRLSTCGYAVIRAPAFGALAGGYSPAPSTQRRGNPASAIWWGYQRPYYHVSEDLAVTDQLSPPFALYYCHRSGHALPSPTPAA